MSLPERSSRMNVNPPAVPTAPEWRAEKKPKATASGNLLNCWFRWALKRLKLLGSVGAFVPRLERSQKRSSYNWCEQN